MKKIKLVLIIVFLLFLSSCYTPITYKTNFNERFNYNIEKYYLFPEKNIKYSRPVSNNLLTNIFNFSISKKEENLTKVIIDTLNIYFLIENLDNSKLEVTLIKRQEEESYIEEEYLFYDKNVGKFDVLLLKPKEIKKFPAIIGLHGHSHSNLIFRDKYMGKELAENGFVVIMPSFRAMNGNYEESNITNFLYSKGFSLMGIRVYEVLLVIKFLKYSDFVDATNIGIIGHSGGSSISNLVLLISNEIKASVIDYEVTYPDIDETTNLIHCETIPEFANYNEDILNSTHSKSNQLVIPYGGGGFRLYKEEIIAFFTRILT